MTEDDVRELLVMIDATYQNFTTENTEAMVKTWLFALEEYPKERIMRGFKNFMQSENKGFAPSVGQLISHSYDAEDFKDLTEIQVSTILMKAIRNSAYNSETEFNKLPDTLKKVVGSASQLKIWATSQDFNMSVIESNIQRTYRDVRAQEKEYRRMSPEQKRLALEYYNTRPQIDVKRTEVPKIEVVTTDRADSEAIDGYMKRLRAMMGG